MKETNVIVIGGGAAGFFAAINCADLHSNYKITILEKSNKLLSKVRVSGGGRCNVTHACFDNNLLIKNYPRGEKELRNVFSRFTTTDTINWFLKRGVELKTEADGRMFPVSNSSESIVHCLLSEAEKLGITIKQGVDISEIKVTEKGGFVLIVNGGGQFECDKLVIATGGNSKETAYDWFKKIGHSIQKPVPSLFTFNIPNNDIVQLMGVAVQESRVKIAGTKLLTEGPLLITHWGLSGPAILKASAWGARQLAEMNYHFTALITWLPKHTEEKLRIELTAHKEEYSSKLAQTNIPDVIELPKRLWEFLMKKSGVSNELRWADVSKKQLNILVNLLLADEYKVQGKTTFKEEFVTCGGINLKEIDLTTMQSKIVPNLFFAGEVIDVDGITGGFNFQNAWSTGWLVANSM